MKKIAIPVTGNTLSPHFGHCEYFKFYEVKNQMVINEEMIKAPIHKSNIILNWLIDRNTTDIITNGIGHNAIEILNQNKINVFVGAEVKHPKDLLNDLMNGTLETDGNLCDH